MPRGRGAHLRMLLPLHGLLPLLFFLMLPFGSKASCGLCSNGADIGSFNANKPYPFQSVNPPQILSQWSDLSCGGLNTALSSSTANLFQDCPDSAAGTTFTSFPFNMPAYCECPGIAPPKVCGNLCPLGSSVPRQLKKKKVIGSNFLTCGEIETLVQYTQDEELCLKYQMNSILECCLSDLDNGAILMSRNGTTIAPTTAKTTTSKPSSARPTSANPTLLPTPNVTATPTVAPITMPPTPLPTNPPTQAPTPVPSTAMPTTLRPTTPPGNPTLPPTTPSPTKPPTLTPTPVPTNAPTTRRPTNRPTPVPTKSPTMAPSPVPSTASPTSLNPTAQPGFPSALPTTAAPTPLPTTEPTALPTLVPTLNPTTLFPTQPPSTAKPTTSCPVCEGEIVRTNILPDGVLCADWFAAASAIEGTSENCLLEQAVGIKYCGCSPPPSAQVCSNQCTGEGSTPLPDARGLTCDSLSGIVNVDGFRTCSILSTKYSSLCQCANAQSPVCNLCPNNGQLPNGTKPFPIPIDLSTPLPQVFGDATDLSCQGIENVYTVQTTETCSAIGSNFFGWTPFDLRAWCECPGIAPPQICGDLCVSGTQIPNDRLDLIPDPALGLSCSELNERVKYVSDSGFCPKVQTLRPLCCGRTPEPTSAPPTLAPSADPTTQSPTTISPTVRPGVPSASPTTAAPSTQSPTSTAPTISPTTSRPTAANITTTDAPTDANTTSPTTGRPTIAPSTRAPTVAPGSPSATPTKAPTMSPTLPSVQIASAFQMYNTEGLTSLEASRPSNLMVLNTAWDQFVEKLVLDVEGQRRRQLRRATTSSRRHRRLDITLKNNSSSVYIVSDLACPTNIDPPVPAGANCQSLIGSFDLSLTSDEDPEEVRTKYDTKTTQAIDEGKLQESLDATAPDNYPYAIVGPPVDPVPSPGGDGGLEWWAILLIVLACLLCLSGIGAALYWKQKDSEASEKSDTSGKLVDYDPAPVYPNTVAPDRSVGTEEDEEEDAGELDEFMEHEWEGSSVGEESLVSYRDPDPEVTVCQETVWSDLDNHEEEDDEGSDADETSGPHSVDDENDVEEEPDEETHYTEDSGVDIFSVTLDFGQTVGTDASGTQDGSEDSDEVESVYIGSEPPEPNGRDPSVCAPNGDPPQQEIPTKTPEDPPVPRGDDPSAAPRPTKKSSSIRRRGDDRDDPSAAPVSTKSVPSRRRRKSSKIGRKSAEPHNEADLDSVGVASSNLAYSMSSSLPTEAAGKETADGANWLSVSDLLSESSVFDTDNLQASASSVDKVQEMPDYLENDETNTANDPSLQYKGDLLHRAC